MSELVSGNMLFFILRCHDLSSYLRYLGKEAFSVLYFEMVKLSAFFDCRKQVLPHSVRLLVMRKNTEMHPNFDR